MYPGLQKLYPSYRTSVLSFAYVCAEQGQPAIVIGLISRSEYRETSN